MKVLNLTGKPLSVRDRNGDLQDISEGLAEMKCPHIKWTRRANCSVSLEGLGELGEFDLIEETREIVDMAIDPGILYITSRLIKESFHAKNIVWARELKGKDGKCNGEYILIVSSKIDAAPAPIDIVATPVV